jgi:acetyl-CoA C-acetyltransferase
MVSYPSKYKNGSDPILQRMVVQLIGDCFGATINPA